MKKFFTPKAEALRIKTLYRRLIMEGKVSLPVEEARRLVGPDCAFHLYRRPLKKKEPLTERPSGTPKESL